VDIGSGTSSYKGDPDVVRLAPAAADIATFAAYNATHASDPQAVAGRIFSNSTPFVNLASSYDEGVDLGLNYALPKLPVGNVVLNADWSYVTASRTISLPSNVPRFSRTTSTSAARRAGAARPRSRGATARGAVRSARITSAARRTAARRRRRPCGNRSAGRPTSRGSSTAAPTFTAT
jgi:hypothetical protein